METRQVIYKSPLGPLKLEASAEGICAVKYLFGKHSDTERADASGLTETKPKEGLKRVRGPGHTVTEVPLSSEGSKAEEHLQVCQTWLDAYFAGTLLQSSPAVPKPTLVLPSTGTEFFHSVWDTLASTGVGETLSYKELAKLSGKPNAARAAGQAVKKHSLPILMPCHRVVKSGHGQRSCVEAGNYSGGDGPATKEWLLQHEKKMLEHSK